MLRDKHPCARHFTANRRALKDAHQQQQQRSKDAHRGIGGQQTNGQRRHGHQQNAKGKHILAPDQIAKVGHDNAAQRTRQISGGKNAEGLHLTQPFRDIRREEEFSHHGGEENKDDEVVKFQRAA
ncbi:Uncharacterised protein [Enterobacter asburiae]|nr:Uncharacterised protein [Enterobacter asburiae]